jgi:hypothetical protein
MLIKETYKVLGNNWWKVPNGEFVVTTDTLVVTDVTEEKAIFNVFRDGVVIGEIRVQHAFVNEDFEKIN